MLCVHASGRGARNQRSCVEEVDSGEGLKELTGLETGKKRKQFSFFNGAEGSTLRLSVRVHTEKQVSAMYCFMWAA